MPTISENLISDLHSPDEKTRRYAVEDLVDCGGDEVVLLLVNALADASPAVSEAAIDSLTRIGGDAVVLATLPALRSEHVPLRNAASLLLVQLGQTAIDHLALMTVDGDRDVRMFAVDTLARIGSRSAEAPIIRSLSDSDINVAAAAAAALGEIGTLSAVGSLIAQLTSDSWVRCCVAKSLGQIGGAEASNALVVLTGDEDELVAFAALQALVQSEDVTAHGDVFRGLVDHSNPVIGGAAAAALDRFSFERKS